MRLELEYVLLLCLGLALITLALAPKLSRPEQASATPENLPTPAFFAAAPGSTLTPNSRPPGVAAQATAKAGTVEKDVVYGTVDGVDLKMDVYYPSGLKGPAPAVLYIHGGGWTSGDKREAERIWDVLKRYPTPYVLVSLNYRLAPTHRFPAQIEDVKLAVRYLRANAARYSLDPQRIAALGVSAGGHLATLLGVAEANAGWDVGEHLDQSSAVKAVIVIAGPSDFTRSFPARAHAIARSVFGVTEPSDPLLEQASPVSYVSAGDPAFLILQGEKDSLVPAEQAQVLFDRLRSAKVPADLVMIENAGHSLQSIGGAMSPNPFQVALKIVGFLGKNLK